jgi:hypothetical protein
MAGCSTGLSKDLLPRRGLALFRPKLGLLLIRHARTGREHFLTRCFLCSVRGIRTRVAGAGELHFSLSETIGVQPFNIRRVLIYETQ